MVNLADVPLVEAVKMITCTPARSMVVGDKEGSLAQGKAAEIVIFDDKIQVGVTRVKGRIVNRQEQSALENRSPVKG